MNLPLHSCSIFFLLVLFFISTDIPTSVCAKDSSQYTNCSSAFSCGIVNNVTYPFWGGNRADYCGQPDFQLNCQDSVPKLIVKNITYRILNFCFDKQNLTVARDDYWVTICPSQYRNTSFDSTMFKYVGGVQDLVLLYECISSFNPKGQFSTSPSQCSSNSTNPNVYYGNASSSINLEGVCKAVIIPIFEASVAKVFSEQMNILEAIEEGFGLRWDVNNEECNNCVNSGGECGYSQTQQKFTCFCKDGREATSCSGLSSKRDRRLLIIASAAAGTVGIVIVLTVIICYRNRSFKLGQKISKARRTSHDHHVETFMETYGTLAPRKYTYSEVKRMTESFTTKIGQGGYGTVYKATMPDGFPVAVKVLSETKGTGEEFINEVASISKTSHVNIVSLMGFCYEKNKRALIYEFMLNGSLDKFIYKEDPSNAICNLEWLRLYQIAIGIARGLEYLHQGCNTRILHLDIKPQNILLDEDFCPKISDFGLAKICRKKESIVSILGMRGTIGYIAPEVFSRAYGGVSYKSDVYSYGMLVLEMIGGKRNFDKGGSDNSEIYFPSWIYKELEQSNVLKKDSSITEEENEVISKMTLVSVWCIQTNPADRPSMNKVVEMLEGPNQSLPFPPKPSLYSPPRSPVHVSDDPSSTMLDSNSKTTQTE